MTAGFAALVHVCPSHCRRVKKTIRTIPHTLGVRKLLLAPEDRARIGTWLWAVVGRPKPLDLTYRQNELTHYQEWIQDKRPTFL